MATFLFLGLNVRILVLSRYSDLGASSRHRLFQYFDHFQNHGVSCVASPLISNVLLRKKYLTGKYGYFFLFLAYVKRIYTMLRADNYDLIWVEKEALPWLPAFFEKFLLSRKPYALDFDDAVFHNYDLHRSRLIRFFYSNRIDVVMSNASLVIAGNSYLADRAIGAGARNVRVIPNTVDLNRYKIKAFNANASVVRIVWIGSPFTAKYLNLVYKPLLAIRSKFNFKLRIINTYAPEMPGLDVEFVPWDEGAEVDALRECDIGIMPLPNSPWERGKCGMKLIQYMACGLPIVASPVGVNKEIVRHGVNGYLATSDDDWISSLATLITDSKFREIAGSAGRDDVEAKYSISQASDLLLEALKSAVNLKKF